MRTIKLTDKKLVKLLKEKDDIQKEFIKYSDALNKAQKELEKLGMTMQKIKDKMKLAIRKDVKDLGDYEYPGKIDLVKGVPTLEILDIVEDNAESFKEKAKALRV